MADWEHDEHPREARFERDWRGQQDWRSGPERDFGESRGRGGPGQPWGPEGRAFGPRPSGYGRDEGFRRREGRDERSAGYGQEGRARGYGAGGETAYGRPTRGSSDDAQGGYGGADVGGYGQSGLDAQWGGGGFGPLNQGLDYSGGGGRFGPAGYDTGDFGRHTRRNAPHDEHHASYSTWRDAQLAGHDRDYTHWRNEQARRYDEEYGSWRNERHAAFSKEFEGWRTGRGGQSPGASVSNAEPGYAHGANPTLAKIADGHEAHQPHAKAEPKTQPGSDTDPARH